MLLANMAVAQKIRDAHKSKALLRRHPPPQSRMIDELVRKPLSCNHLVQGSFRSGKTGKVGENQKTFSSYEKVGDSPVVRKSRGF